MCMRTIKTLISAVGLTFAVSQAFAQVISPQEIVDDADLQELQQKHMADLKNLATQISAHPFPYPLYFSRTLGISEEQQKRSDQRSIRFDKFREQTVLEITANYYASYSAELMDREERAQHTLDDVVAPMLQAAIPVLAGEERVQSFAIEVSQHVRRRLLGVTDENSENVAFVLPASAASRLIAAVTPGERQAALLQGQLFVNREPLAGWGLPTPEPTEKKRPPLVPPGSATLEAEARAALATDLRTVSGSLPSQAPKSLAWPPSVPAPVALRAEAAPPVSANSLRTLQDLHQPELDRMVRELGKQANFVSYAPPAFIAFHKGSFLQLSVVTSLKQTAVVSRYQTAALAFDEHIAHLIRPVMAAIKAPADFDGLDFSTTVRLAGTAEGAGVAVEFIFPSTALLGYQDYDLTGQQLINMGFVLINGERVSLELQTAEAGLAPQP